MTDLTQDQPEQSRTSRARDRQRRRRERQRQREQSNRPEKRPAGHLSPAGRLKLPDINTRIVQGVAFVIAAGIFMVALIIAVGMFKNDPILPDPNAYWIDQEWTYESRDLAQVNALASQLRANEVGIIYAHVSELNFDLTWTGLPEGSNQFAEVEPQVRAFVEQIEQSHGNLRTYGVVNIRADLDADGYRLDDPAVIEAISTFSTQVVTGLGFDGVLLNVQPVWNNDENYLQLVREVRRAIGDEALFAVAVPPDWTPIGVDVPVPSNIAPGTVWDEEFKRRVALLQVDQIVLKAFDSYLVGANGFTTNDYSQWLAYQVQAYIDAIAYLDNDTRLIVTLSTEADKAVTRDAEVETVLAGISGVVQGIGRFDDDDRGVLEGIALYSSADTTNTDWDQFNDLWVGRS